MWYLHLYNNLISERRIFLYRERRKLSDKISQDIPIFPLAHLPKSRVEQADAPSKSSAVRSPAPVRSLHIYEKTFVDILAIVLSTLVKFILPFTLLRVVPSSKWNACDLKYGYGVMCAFMIQDFQHR